MQRKGATNASGLDTSRQPVRARSDVKFQAAPEYIPVCFMGQWITMFSFRTLVMTKLTMMMLTKTVTSQAKRSRTKLLWFWTDVVTTTLPFPIENWQLHLQFNLLDTSFLMKVSDLTLPKSLPSKIFPLQFTSPVFAVSWALRTSLATLFLISHTLPTNSGNCCKRRLFSNGYQTMKLPSVK